MLLVLLFCNSQKSGVILLRLLLSFFLLELSESLHFFRGFGNYGGQVYFFAFGLFFENREFFHKLIVLVSFFDKVVTIGSEETVNFWVRQRYIPRSARTPTLGRSLSTHGRSDRSVFRKKTDPCIQIYMHGLIVFVRRGSSE